MQVLGEILQQLEGHDPPQGGGVFTVWQERGGYFQNVKRVEAFTPERVQVKLINGTTLTVEGRELSVKKYVEGDLLLWGKIEGVTMQKKDEGNGSK